MSAFLSAIQSRIASPLNDRPVDVVGHPLAAHRQVPRVASPPRAPHSVRVASGNDSAPVTESEFAIDLDLAWSDGPTDHQYYLPN